MKRRLQANERSGAPQSYVAIDTETYPQPDPDNPNRQTNRFLLGCGIYWEMRHGRITRQQIRTFTAREMMLAWLLSQGSPKRRTWIFAHNIGFDLTVLRFWDAINDGLISPYYRNPKGGDEERLDGMMVIEDPPVILDMVAAGAKRQTYLDLMQFIQRPLSEIGRMVDLEKLAPPGDEADDGYLGLYCLTDTKIVQRAVVRILNMVRYYDMGNLRYTASGQSVALWRHLKPTPDVVLGHGDDAKEMERRAYRGMGCTNFFVGRAVSPDLFWELEQDHGDLPPRTDRTNGVYRLDVNSCYPYVMHEYDYPVEYCYHTGPVSVDDLTRRLGQMEGIADVVIASESNVYPVEQDGEIVWATGRFACTLAGPELREALAAGDVVRVDGAQMYRRGRPFAAFVERIWHLREHFRKEGKALEAALVKLIGNSLWGKLGQRSVRWACRPGRSAPYDWGTWTECIELTGEVTEWRSLGQNCQQRLPPGEGLGNFPAIAAYVASYARCYLRGIIRTAGPRSVYYWDADSVHTSSEGFARLISAGLADPVKPGCLKTESSHQSAEWRGPKNYRLDDVWVRAGVRPKARVTEGGIVEDVQFHGLAAVVTDGPPPGPVTENVRFALPEGRVRGVVGADGWVLPPRVFHG